MWEQPIVPRQSRAQGGPHGASLQQEGLPPPQRHDRGHVAAGLSQENKVLHEVLTWPVTR